jgi:hypothetical protein
MIRVHGVCGEGLAILQGNEVGMNPSSIIGIGIGFLILVERSTGVAAIDGDDETDTDTDTNTDTHTGKGGKIPLCPTSRPSRVLIIPAPCRYHLSQPNFHKAAGYPRYRTP